MRRFPGRGWLDGEKGPSFVGILEFIGLFSDSYLEYCARLHQPEGPGVASKFVASNSERVTNSAWRDLPALQDVSDGKNQPSVSADSAHVGSANQPAPDADDIWKQRQKEQRAYRDSVIAWIKHHDGDVFAQCANVLTPQLLCAKYMNNLIKRTPHDNFIKDGVHLSCLTHIDR